MASRFERDRQRALKLVRDITGDAQEKHVEQVIRLISEIRADSKTQGAKEPFGVRKNRMYESVRERLALIGADLFPLELGRTKEGPCWIAHGLFADQTIFRLELRLFDGTDLCGFDVEQELICIIRQDWERRQ